MKNKEAFKLTQLFKDVSEKTLNELLTNSETQVRKFNRGEKIFPNKEKSLCILLQGIAESFNGQTLIQQFKYADIFGAASIFHTELPPTLILAKTKCTAIYISRSALCAAIKSDPEFAIKYIHFLSGKIHFLNKKIDAFTTESANKKAAKYLYAFNDTEFDLPVSITRLAGSLCLSRASLYRAFEELEKSGLIERSQRHIRVLDREKLNTII